MTKEARDQLARASKVLGVIIALLGLVALIAAAGDDRYVQKADYRADQEKIDGKITRVLDVVCEGKEHTRACQP